MRKKQNEKKQNRDKKLYKWMTTVKRKGEDSHIYIYKVVISVCLFVCQIINHEHLDLFASIFERETWENHGNVLC